MSIKEGGKDIKATGVQAARRHTSNNQKIFENNIESLQSIIELCYSMKVDVFLYTSPASDSYYYNMDSTQLEVTLTEARRLADDNQHVYYVDFIRDDSFGEKDFMMEII